MKLNLNAHQADLLRYLSRQTRPVRPDELDGRVLRALMARGCIERERNRVNVTEVGRRWLVEQKQGRAPGRRRRGRQPRQLPGRAVMIIRAVEQLESVIPLGAEVRVGQLQAAADDVLQALRQHARRLSASC